MKKGGYLKRKTKLRKKPIKNGFKDRKAWMFHYACHICGMNGWDALHHILGRGSSKQQTHFSSILNSAPVHNYTCHINIHGKLMKWEMQVKLLEKTRKYLDSIDYPYNGNDRYFIEYTKKYYASKD